MNDLKMSDAEDKNIFTCPIVEVVDGELAIEFSDELMEALDLKVGDGLQWKQLIDGSFTLNKK